MKKLIVIGLTALATLFVAIGVAPSASAYPEQSCSVEVDAQIVDSGDSFTATGTSNQFTVDDGLGRAGAQQPVDWTVTFNGDVRESNGVSFAETFQVPEVTKVTKLPLTVSAVMADMTTNCTKTVDITIVPAGTTIEPPEEELPNTGGPRLALLLAGLGLLLAGGVAIRQSRKGDDGRHSA